jgi:NADH-quinone oxidoreductase subunit J
MMAAVIFFIAAAIVLLGACGVILLKNPVHAALSLVATLFGIAIHFINLEAYFLAAVQVIVYAGAIVILFLFVIMLLGVDRAENISAEPILGQRQFAALALVGFIVLGILIGIATAGDITGVPPEAASSSPAEGGLAIDQSIESSDGTIIAPEENIRDIGRVLFSTRYVLALEITALLLTIAVVGAVVLARRPREEFEDIPEIEPPLLLRTDSMEEPPPEGLIETSDIELAVHDSENENQAVSESGVATE